VIMDLSRHFPNHQPAELVYRDCHGNLIRMSVWINEISMEYPHDCNINGAMFGKPMMIVQMSGILNESEVKPDNDGVLMIAGKIEPKIETRVIDVE
jgi:hypothetical protein